MVTIFYDFETSSRDPLGQILSYAFIAVDEQGSTLEEHIGWVTLSRLQLPSPDAILVNRINVLDLEAKGRTEFDAANDIHAFLSRYIAQYGTLTLAGFNTNSFDLTFLRNLFIKHGMNPYFRGKVLNKDVLHFAQHLAFEHPDTYPWRLKESATHAFFSFKLEDVAQGLGCLSEAQTHDALDDVRLTIRVAHTLERLFGLRFNDFQPIHFVRHEFGQHPVDVGKQKARHFAPLGTDPEPYRTTYWLRLLSERKTKLMLDLEAYQSLDSESRTPESVLGCITYVNENKSFFRVEPLDAQEDAAWSPVVQQAQHDPFLRELSVSSYFALTEKDWDIEYQIHKLPFDHMDKLGRLVKQLVSHPDSYEANLNQLMAQRHSDADTHLLRLYNRAYLNYHPHPRPDYLSAYMHRRYVSKEMLRRPEEGCDLEHYETDLDKRLDDPSIDDSDKVLLKALKTHFQKRVNLTF